MILYERIFTKSLFVFCSLDRMFPTFKPNVQFKKGQLLTLKNQTFCAARKPCNVSQLTRISFICILKLLFVTLNQQPSFHGSIKKKKKKRKKSRKRSSKKGKKKRRSKRGSRKGSKKSSGSSTKKGDKSNSSKKKSTRGSKKSSKSASNKGSPKKSSRGKRKKYKKHEKKKSKGHKKGKRKKGSSRSSKKKQLPKQEALPGNRREIPPLRLGIDVLGFHDIYINQIDVDPLEEENYISAGDGDYTPTAGTGTGTTESSEHGPVDPQKLAKALEDAKKGKDKKKGGKNSSRGSKKSKSRSKSPSSGTKRGSKKGSKGGSKKTSKRGSKKASKEGSKNTSKTGSKKGSKRGSKKGSKGGSKKGSPKRKKNKSKSPKGKKKSRKRTLKKKPADTVSTAATEPADTWSVASETTIKRGRAIMLSEVPRKMITQFQGNPIKIRVERYGGKHHNNGEVIPVGTVTVPFPPDWSEAIMEVQREINPRTYDASAFPIERGIVGRYSIKDGSNEYIGDIKLEMNLYCFANTAVSKLFPTDTSLYDALIESENIPKCCDAMSNKRRGRRSNLKADEYYGYKPGGPNPYEYAWEYARRQKEIEKQMSTLDRRTYAYGANLGGTHERMMGDYSFAPRGNPNCGPLFNGAPRADEDYGGQSGECYDVYPKAKNMNYTERFNL